MNAGPKWCIVNNQRERYVLFNDALNTFCQRLYGVRHMVMDHSDSETGNPLRHIGYSYRLTATVLLYAPSYRQDNTYHGLCYTSRGALAGTRNSSMGPPHEGSIRRTMSERSTSETLLPSSHHERTLVWVLAILRDNVHPCTTVRFPHTQEFKS